MQITQAARKVVSTVFAPISEKLKARREAQNKLDVACCKLDRLILSSEKPEQKGVDSSVEIEGTTDGGFVKITRFFFPDGDFAHAEVLLQDPFNGPRTRLFWKTCDGKLTVSIRGNDWVDHDSVRLCDVPVINEILEVFRNARKKQAVA